METNFRRETQLRAPSSRSCRNLIDNRFIPDLSSMCGPISCPFPSFPPSPRFYTTFCGSTFEQYGNSLVCPSRDQHLSRVGVQTNPSSLVSPLLALVRQIKDLFFGPRARLTIEFGTSHSSISFPIRVAISRPGTATPFRDARGADFLYSRTLNTKRFITGASYDV